MSESGRDAEHLEGRRLPTEVDQFGEHGRASVAKGREGQPGEVQGLAARGLVLGLRRRQQDDHRASLGFGGN